MSISKTEAAMSISKSSGSRLLVYWHGRETKAPNGKGDIYSISEDHNNTTLNYTCGFLVNKEDPRMHISVENRSPRHIDHLEGTTCIENKSE